MSPYAIHLRSYSPDVSIEFDLPPGSHARIGASPDAEVTLPLAEVAPFLCTLGRFLDGRLYLADTDGAISQRVDLPTTLSFPPYQFVVFSPAYPEEDIPNPETPARRKSRPFLKFFGR